MTDKYALYSRRMNRLPELHMQTLAPDNAPKTSILPIGLTYLYEWEDLQITCSVLPREQKARHLDRLTSWVVTASKSCGYGDISRLVLQIRETKMVVDVTVEPETDARGRTDEALVKLCYGLRPLIFFNNGLYDHNFFPVLVCHECPSETKGTCPN